MPPAKTTVAAFDFDGTLSTRDCVVPFMRAVAGTARLSWGLVRRPVALFRALVRRDRDLLKAAAAHAAFAGRRSDLVDDAGRRFADEIIGRRLRQDTRLRLADHVASGDRVVLVSASLEPYLVPVGAALGVDDVLCTRLEQGLDGRLTGNLLGANCRGREKLERLRSWLESEHLTRENVDLVVYGDSAGDHELLAEADTAFWAAGPTLAAWRSP